MGHTFRFPRRIGLILAALIAAGALTGVIAGCSDDDNPPPAGGGTQSTTFVGAFTNGTESGKITVVIGGTSLAGRLRAAAALRPASGASLTATGTLRFIGGSTTALTGTYDTATDSLNLSGGGYIFHGEYDDTGAPPHSVGGYYTGPGAAGTFGAFAGSTTTIEIYLGTFQSDSTGVTGVFDMARVDTLAGAIACPQGDEALFLDGTAAGAGTLKTITLSNSEPGLFEVTATGTLDTSLGTVTGVWHTWDAGASKGDDGTWSGTLSP